MKFVNKIFIFESLLQTHTTRRCNNSQRHLERPCICCNLACGSLGLRLLQGLFICSWLQSKMAHISGVLLTNTLKRVHFLPSVIWFRSMPIRRSMGARREVFTEAFSFFSLCFFKLSTSFFPFCLSSFKHALTLNIQYYAIYNHRNSKSNG